jgi:hypothetical protein
MTTTIRAATIASLSATALALLLRQPVLAEVPTAAADAPAAAPATAEAQPAKPKAAAPHPARAARAAIEERRAARRAELDKRYEALRTEAASQGFEMPPAPPWTDGPQWLSYEEMQELMKAQGVDLPVAPDPDKALAQPPMPAPPLGVAGPDEQKRIFDIIAEMTPEQQEACFAISRWHRPPGTPQQMPPHYSPPRMPHYPPAYVPGYGQRHPGMVPQR